jgi:hypothetical protein
MLPSTGPPPAPLLELDDVVALDEPLLAWEELVDACEELLVLVGLEEPPPHP